MGGGSLLYRRKIYVNRLRNEKIYSDWSLLKRTIDQLRACGKKIILTSGTFDLLHPGHVYLIQQARRLGDILVVAINNDQSVRHYKGASRPINSLINRMIVVSAFEEVSFVVSFTQDTCEEIVSYLRPDTLVKGGDYKKELVAGYNTVMAYGGRVHIVDYITTFSTTKIIHSVIQKTTVQ